MLPSQLSPRRYKLGLALGLLGPALAAMGCNPYTKEAGPASGTGGLGLQLKLSSEVTVSSITYQLLRGSEFVRSGAFMASPDSEMFDGFIGQLPQATAYQLSLDTNATLVGGKATTRCSGKASFGIVRGKTTTVAVRLRCAGVPGDELAERTTQGNSCPSISMLLAQPAMARIGEPISVNAEALDDDAMPKALSFRWSTPNGTGSFSSAVDPATTFMCSRAGSAELVLVVSDGDPNCPFEESRVTVACEASPNTAALPKSSNAGSAGLSGSAGSPAPLAGAQAPASTAGRGSTIAATTAPLTPQAGRGSSSSLPPPPGANRNDPQQPAFDAGAPASMEEPSNDPPDEPPAQDDQDPPPPEPDEPAPPNGGDEDPPPPPGQPSQPGRDGGQPRDPDRNDRERDAGQPEDGERQNRNRDRNRERDAGWPRDQGGDDAAGRGGRRDAPPPTPDDPADAGAPETEGP